MVGAGCSITGNYIYCVATGNASPYTQVYYAQVSTTGVGTWTASTSYPVGMDYASCQIPGTGGGYFGGGGPVTTTTSTSTTVPYIYCIAGYTSSGVNNVYYAPISSTGVGTWSSTTNYPIATYWQDCASYHGFVYCVGGQSSYSNVYYAPISTTGVGTWTSGTSYPIALTSTPAACTTYNSFITCTGGNSIVNTVYYAAISSTGVGAWTAGTGYPANIIHHGCTLTNGYIYCVAGAYNSAYTSNAYYAPVLASNAIGTWSSTASYPLTLGYQTCTSANGYIYCVTGANIIYYNSVYYAPVSTTGVGTWSSTTNYPIALYKLTCASYSNTIYCVTGNTGSSINNVYYAPISSTGVGTWSSTKNYPLTEDNAGGQCVTSNP
jgi:hypothetical protein